MWDGVIGRYALESRNWSIINNWLLDSNWYITYAIFLLADSAHRLTEIPHWIIFKLWITLLIVGVGYEVYRLAKSVFDIQHNIAAWLPALIFSFPIWYVFFSYSSIIGHLTCVWLALIGYRLLFASRQPIFLLGCVLIVFSFQLASNCAFLVTLEFVRWLTRSKNSSWKCSRLILVLSLSISVFFLMRIVWPPVEMYVSYNKLLSPFEINSWFIYVQKSFFWGTWLVLLLPVSLATAWNKKPAGVHEQFNLTALLSHKATLTSFTLLIFAACAPYIAVGLASPLFVVRLQNSNSVSAALASNSSFLSVWYGGWGARHSLLLMIVLAILVSCLVQFLNQSSKFNQNRGFEKKILATTVAFYLVFLVPGHYAKLTRIAQEQTIVELLKRTQKIPDGQIDFLLDKKIDYLLNSYEANYLLYRAYRDTSWFAYIFPDHPVVYDWIDNNRKLILQQPKHLLNLIAGQHVMIKYDWSDQCKTVVRLVLPKLSMQDVLWNAEYSSQRLPPAIMQPVSTDCKSTEPFWIALAVK